MRTTSPHNASTSVARPCARSSAMLERALPSMRNMRAATKRNSGVGRRSTAGSQVGGSGVSLAGSMRAV